LKIVLLHNEYGAASGEERVVHGLRRLLEQRNHHVIPFIRSSAEIRGKRKGQVQAFFSGIYSWSSKRAIRSLLGRRRPDLVHVHNVFPLISPSVLGECRRCGVPVVMTVHNYRLVCPSGLLMTDGQICEKCAAGREYWCVLRNCQRSLFRSSGYALRNYVARKSRMFLDNVTMYAPVSNFQRQRLIAAGFPPGRIAVIPNMAQARTRQDGNPLGSYVGYVGRVSPEKGVPLLMAAARLHGDIPFKAAGRYDRMPDLPAEAPANFHFLGHLGAARLQRFYSHSRIVALCSLCHETFGLCVVEGALQGKPAVCPRTGGLPEVVDDGVTGLLFEPGSVADLAAKVRYLWDRPGQCRKMGEAARRKALREYSPQRYYERLMKLYATAMSLGPGGTPRC